MRPRKRLTAAILAALGAFVASYSGLPEETLNALLLSLSGIVSAYIAGQSWSDAAERKGAQAAEIEAEQVVPPVEPFFKDEPPVTFTTSATGDLDLHRILKKGAR